MIFQKRAPRLGWRIGITAGHQIGNRPLGKGNLIPSNHSLKTWIQKYYRVIRGKGISKKECGASSHGCRHAYAQDRYEEITGFKAPCKFEFKEKSVASR